MTTRRLCSRDVVASLTFDVALDFPAGVCACGSPDLAIVAGRELRIKEVEVAG